MEQERELEEERTRKDQEDHDNKVKEETEASRLEEEIASNQNAAANLISRDIDGVTVADDAIAK